jgi:hypothetical protein
MAGGADMIAGHRYDFEADRLDASMLVGHQITLFTQQLPGKPIYSKVLSVSDGQVLIEGGARFDIIQNLVSNQPVVVQFNYRGERLAVKSLLRRSTGGRCYLKLSSRITPLSQRRFRRWDMIRTARLATYPLLSFQHRQLDKLRWMETSTLNVSSGGALVAVPSVLEPEVFLLINMEMTELNFPQLVLGQVKHCVQLQDLQFHAGVEFVVRERARQLGAATRQQQLPPSLFAYTSTDRERLNRDLAYLNRN